VLGVENAVAAFKSYGSTAPVEVRRQIERWRGRLYEQEGSPLQMPE